MNLSVRLGPVAEPPPTKVDCQLFSLRNANAPSDGPEHLSKEIIKLKAQGKIALISPTGTTYFGFTELL
jgi:hypothetical protein